MSDHVDRVYDQMLEEAEETGASILHTKKTRHDDQRNGLTVLGAIMESGGRAIVSRHGWTPDGIFVNLSGLDTETGEAVGLTVLQIDDDVHIAVDSD